MKSSFESRTTEEVAAILDTDLHAGLRRKEAQKRLREQGENRIYDYRLPVLSGIGSLFFDLSSVLLLIAMLICAFLSHPDYALLIGVAWAINRLSCGLAYLLRVRDHYASALSRIPRVIVVRDGKKRWVDSRCLVPGDLVLLSAGNAVCFDGRVVRSSGFAVSTAGKTSVPDGMVFAGMSVAAGEACVLVTATGDHTQAVSQQGFLPLPSPGGDLSGYAKVKHAALAVRSLPFEKICRVQGVVSAAFVLLAAGYALFSGMQGDALLTAFISAACAVASSFSDLLFAGWNCGISRICRNSDRPNASAGTLRILSEERLPELREADSIFMPLSILAGQDGMQIDTLVTPNGTITALPFARKPNRETIRLAHVLAELALCFADRKDPFLSSVPRGLPDACRGCSVARKTATISWSVYSDAGSGLSVARIQRGARGELAVVGDAETVLRRCNRFEDGGESVPISADTASGLSAVLRHYRDCGFSVSALAVSPSPEGDVPTRPASICQNMELLGFCVYAKRRTAGVSDFLKACLEKKMRLRLFSDMPSGDALNVCGTLGLDKRSLTVLTSSNASAEPDPQWLNCGLYIGCSTPQKQKLLAMAQKNGEKCIFFADGADEKICLKTADFAVSAIPHPQIGMGCDALYSVSHAAFSGSPCRLLQVQQSVSGLQTALLHATRLLCTVQAARFLWFLISLFAFQAAPVPGGVLLSGLLLDLLVLLSSVERIPEKPGSDFENIRRRQSAAGGWLPVLSASGIWILMSLASYAFLRLLSIPASYPVVSLLSLLLFGAGMMLPPERQNGEGRKVPTVSSLFSLLLVCGIAVTGCLVPAAGELLCGCPIRWPEFAAAAVAALSSVFLSHSLALALRRNLKKMRSMDDK